MAQPIQADRLPDVSLTAWAQRWGFMDGWALELARLNAGRWREEPDRVVMEWRRGGGLGAHVPIGTRLHTTRETYAVWRARSDEYAVLMRAAPGLIKTPEKRGSLDHFEWLALHHVAGLRLEDVAEQYQDPTRGLSVSTVSEAISTTAELVGLTLRVRPGRKT